MRFSFRYRSVTAVLMLILSGLALIWPPTGIQVSQWLSWETMWSAPLILGQSHLGISIVALATTISVAVLLYMLPHYSKWLAYLSLAVCVGMSLIAFGFAFHVPAAWLLPSLAAWRLCGGRGLFRT